MKLGNRLLFFSSIILFFIACESNPLLVKLPQSYPSLEFVFVDDALLSEDKIEVQTAHNHFLKTLGNIYRYELSMNLQQREVDTAIGAVMRFYQSPYVQSLEAEKKGLVSQVEAKKSELEKAFAYYKFHFSNAPIPTKVAFMNKMFSGIKCSDSIITVGLENYLGAENEVIQSIPSDQLYNWQKERMDIHFLNRDIAIAWVQAHLFNEIDDMLIKHIIQAGKVLYVVQALFPSSPPEYILRYSTEDYKWASANEKMFWEYLVKEEMLFKNGIRERINFLNEGPYTIGISDKSPDRMGQFLGYKMVKNYSSKNKNLSLEELLNLDFNVILQAYEID